jgi:ATP-binding cassette, subfamily B, bacterial PglK
MTQFFVRFMYVLQGKYKPLVLMLCLFLFTSFLEVIGIGMIGPFIALATDPKAIQQNVWLKSFYTLLNLSSDNQFLLIIGLIVVIIFYLKTFLNFCSQKYIFEFGLGQQAELSYRLMKAYLAAPYTFHLNRNSATLIQNITNESSRFTNGLMMPLLTSISNGIVALALLGLLVKTNLLALVLIAGVLLIASIILLALKDRLKRWGREISEANTETIRAINHGLGGLKETKVIGCESYFESELDKQVKKFSVSASLALSFGNLPRYMIEAALITFLIIFTIIFININQNAQVLSSVLGIFALASIRLLPAISNIVSSISGMRSCAYSLDKLYFDFKELADYSKQESEDFSSKSESNPTKSPLAFVDKISLKNIFYQYPNAEKNSLSGIALSIKKGQSIGLIGKSGSGKTTLVDVILGLLIPQAGDISVDDVSIYTNLRSWQDLLGYVPQSIFLTDDTLRRNIAFGVPDSLIDEKRLLEAIKLAQLSELVEQLPQGLETQVGERGVLLSGGQRQRVGIARVLYYEREILVFDEATAALDNETEALVTEAIKSLSGTKTMLIIAHRLSTIEHCDTIYVVEKGQVVDSGSFNDVVLREKDDFSQP